jgi:hypothetical protein
LPTLWKTKRLWARDRLHAVLVHQCEHFRINPESDSTRGAQRRLHLQSLCHRSELNAGDRSRAPAIHARIDAP